MVANRKTVGIRTFEARLREHLKDAKSKAIFENYKAALNIAMQIVELRKKNNLSQEQLAELMGTSQQAISRIESGDYKGFTLRTLANFARATDTQLEITFKKKKLRRAS